MTVSVGNDHVPSTACSWMVRIIELSFLTDPPPPLTPPPHHTYALYCEIKRRPTSLRGGVEITLQRAGLEQGQSLNPWLPTTWSDINTTRYIRKTEWTTLKSAIFLPTRVHTSVWHTHDMSVHNRIPGVFLVVYKRQQWAQSLWDRDRGQRHGRKQSCLVSLSSCNTMYIS